MERRAVRVEPYSSYLERRRKGPIFPVTVAGGFVFVSGLPPFDRASGEAARRPFAEQAETVLEQMKALPRGRRVVALAREVFARYFPSGSPARIFLCVAAFPGSFDIEVDCIAVL